MSLLIQVSEKPILDPVLNFVFEDVDKGQVIKETIVIMIEANLYLNLYSCKQSYSIREFGNFFSLDIQPCLFLKVFVPKVPSKFSSFSGLHSRK